MEKQIVNYKLKFKKGDTVMVITGNSKGKSGRVLEILKDKNRVLIEGINIITKHSKPTKANPDGGIIKKEAPIHLSNIMLMDPKTNQPTRVGRRVNAKDKIVRYAKKSGEDIIK